MGNFEIISVDKCNAAVDIVNKEKGIEYLRFSYQSNDANAQKVTVKWSVPLVDMFSLWSADCGFNRSIYPEWLKSMSTKSRMASGAPVQSVISQSGNNRLTIAVSDAKTPIEIRMGVREEDATIQCEVSFFTIPIGEIKDYKAIIRIDNRDIPYYTSLYDVEQWWCEIGYKSAPVPINAKLPMYSCWYSFHQHINVEKIVKQCKIAKQLGFSSVIVDDGWQTEDSNRGYSHCGEWNVAKSKVDDMYKFVSEIHNVGMKFILWYSVPFVGIKSLTYDRFVGKYLNQGAGNSFCLDPRYPDVREYLISIYENAVKDWDIDGLKLDFIDSFKLTDLSDDKDRDYTSLEDAVEILLRDITERLRKIKPDILIEFRQGYIGPLIKSFGNMLRVWDCPNDSLKNRLGCIDLRLTSGNTAVHSDMLMWHCNDTVESAAKQIINVLFAVPQVSMKLDEMNGEHQKMLKFYIKFWLDNKHVLLDGSLKPYNPEANYSMVIAQNNKKTIAVCYTKNVVRVCGNMLQDLTIVNGTDENEVIIITDCEYKGLNITILNCKGEMISEYFINIQNDVNLIKVPVSGIIKMKRQL